MATAFYWFVHSSGCPFPTFLPYFSAWFTHSPWRRRRQFLSKHFFLSAILPENSFTHSLMELSPSWEAANCAPTQELPSILWNPKAHYRVHKSPAMVPILNQINPIHTIPSYFSKIHFNIVHPPTTWSSQWSLPFWLSYMHCLSPPFVLYALSMSSSLTSWF
jgi:hypothetical protein